MPNWATGSVRVKGNPKNVKNFCKLFVFDEDTDVEGSKEGKYFARSFMNQKWSDFEKNIEGKSEVSFLVDFAWSCWSCIFKGYPNGKECVTLEWACKKYKVSVEIESEESGVGFEEKITADKTGANYESIEMQSYECNYCGNKQFISSSCDLEDEECCECGKSGAFVDKLKDMVKKKVEIG